MSSAWKRKPSQCSYTMTMQPRSPSLRNNTACETRLPADRPDSLCIPSPVYPIPCQSFSPLPDMFDRLACSPTCCLPTCRWLCGVLFLLASCLPVSAQSLSQKLKTESVETLAKDAREKGNAIVGAILLTRKDLACTRCHDSGATQPIAPSLRQMAADEPVSDVHLVESLLQPSKVIKKGYESVRVLNVDGQVITGRPLTNNDQRLVLQVFEQDVRQIELAKDDIEQLTTAKQSLMPDNLVDQLANRQQFLDLTRYLMELKENKPASNLHAQPVGGETIRPALRGVALLSELNCTACHSGNQELALPAKTAPNLQQSSNAIRPEFLLRFIADPVTVKPGTTMPDVMAHLTPAQRQQAATELTHYVVSLSDQSLSDQPLDAQASDRGKELFHSVGCVACHSPLDDTLQPLLPESSVPLGPTADKYHRDGLRAFLENPLATRPAGRMPNMKLDHWEANDLASYLVSSKQATEPTAPFVVDAKLAERGRERFVELRCNQCHQLQQNAKPNASLAIAELRVQQGCLSKSSTTSPRFDLTDLQREQLQVAVRSGGKVADPIDHLNLQLTAFRCVNCHQRDQLGGVSEARNPYFKTGDPNLGPQGRIPPPLTNAGSKLKPQWMRQVLVSGRAIRPYVLTRMPQFGTDNVGHLVEAFQELDPQIEPPQVTFDDQKEIRKVGGELVGSQGLNCIACHSFQLKKAANMSAVDLTEMAERLHKGWFDQYMRQPQTFNPNTIMPSFWPGGRAMREDYVDGNTDLQIEAMWQYLLDGRQARTPRGLITEPIELLANDEAVILRRSYPGIGKRGIGVGYPSQVNLSYDAEQMRLASIWQGKFADPGGVWRSQGHGRVRPLGERPIQFMPGPDLDSADQPWAVDDGRPPNHQFRGYSLDEKQRPRLQYQFGDLQVEDYFVDAKANDGQRGVLRRTIVIDAKQAQPGLVFRAANGQEIKQVADNVFLIDSALWVTIVDGKAVVANDNETQRLQLPLNLKPGRSTITLKYSW